MEAWKVLITGCSLVLGVSLGDKSYGQWVLGWVRGGHSSHGGSGQWRKWTSGVSPQPRGTCCF